MTIKQKNNQEGMTLVEVLVALAVVSIALSALLGGMANYADYYGGLRDRFWSNNISWNELATVQVAQETGALSSLPSTGTSDQLSISWRWNLEVEDTASPAIKLLRLSTDFPSGEGASTLSTMIMEGSGFSRLQLQPGEVIR